MAKDSRSVPTAKRTLHETFNALNVDQGKDTKVLQVIFGIPIQLQTISNTLENNPSDPLFTSTPLKKLLNQTPRQETKVQLVVEYPSKIIKKELKEHFAVIAKAIANGSPDSCQRCIEEPCDQKAYFGKIFETFDCSD